MSEVRSKTQITQYGQHNHKCMVSVTIEANWQSGQCDHTESSCQRNALYLNLSLAKCKTILIYKTFSLSISNLNFLWYLSCEYKSQPLSLARFEVSLISLTNWFCMVTLTNRSSTIIFRRTMFFKRPCILWSHWPFNSRFSMVIWKWKLVYSKKKRIYTMFFKSMVTLTNRFSIY